MCDLYHLKYFTLIKVLDSFEQRLKLLWYLMFQVRELCDHLHINCFSIKKF